MPPPLLTPLDEQLRLRGGMGIDGAVVEPFRPETAATGYGAYLSGRLAGELGMRRLVVGYDFHLGRGREGSQERLSSEGLRLGFGVTIVPPVVLQGSVVSSTKIRRDVMERRFEHAARSLGHPYFFDAEVVGGEGIGRDLGFPTANLSVDDARKLLPPRGVYAVMVETAAGRYGGMMNVGSAPTVRGDASRRIEVHLFAFSGELRGERLRTHCIAFMREERRFAGAEELRAQLLQDRAAACGILEKKY
jgi:riboflavin kinase/FMN adenylyltransferase